MALGSDAGCKHKGKASPATGPGPRSTPAAPSPPARSTSSLRRSAPPTDYTQRRTDQPECAAVPRLEVHPPISARGRRSFSFSGKTHSGQPHPYPAHQSSLAVLPRGVVPVTPSNQRPRPTPPSPTTPTLREPYGAVSPRPLPRPPISAHARCMPNRRLLTGARCSCPVCWPHLPELLCSPLNAPVYLDSTLHPQSKTLMKTKHARKAPASATSDRSSSWSLQPLVREPLGEDPCLLLNVSRLPPLREDASRGRGQQLRTKARIRSL